MRNTPLLPEQRKEQSSAGYAQVGIRYFACALVLLIISLYGPAFGQILKDEDAITSASAVAEIVEDATEDRALATAYQRMVSNPISPPDTASPRATIESFLVIMDAASRLLVSVRDTFFDSNALSLSKDEKDKLLLVQALFEKAADTMDLSDIPAAALERTSIERVLQLQEIFDRIYLPPPDDIPGLEAGSSAAFGNGPDKWIIPGTSLTIEKQESGPRRGEYLFTKATVDRIPDDYDTVNALPLHSDRGEDLYEYYIYTPGNLTAPSWYKFILEGPSWLRLHAAGQALWQWGGLAITLIITVIFLAAFARWHMQRAVPLDPASRQLRHLTMPVLIIVLAKTFRYLCEEHINITGSMLQLLSTLSSAVAWATLAYLTYQGLQLVYLWTARNPTMTKASLDASMLRTGFRVASFLAAVIVLGYGAARIGIPVYGVVAGLGVGGLAIALAARPTLENFISGIILYSDGIVRVGDFCAFETFSGTVEEIGIRSTRIRALDRTLIIVSNADLANGKIINYSRRDVFMFRHKVALRHGTGKETLLTIKDEVTTMFEADDAVLEAPLRIRLVRYEAGALLIDIYANIAATSMDDFLEVQEALLIGVRHIVIANGAAFALPASTIYLTADELPVKA